MTTISERDELVKTLRSPAARRAFVAESITGRLPMKIRAIRMAQGLSQQQLARRMGKKQAWVSKLEDPNYAAFSLKTLLETADALDVALEVDFVPFSQLLDRALNFSSADLQVQRFSEEFSVSRAEQGRCADVGVSARMLPGGNLSGNAACIEENLIGRSDMGILSSGWRGNGAWAHA